MKAISKCRPCACARRADPEEMEHRATALCSLGGRQECLPYLRQEYLPYLNADSECSVPSVPSVCSVPSEFSEEFCCSRNLPRGTIGPEGVCEAYGEEGREEKAFFAKQTHFKTSDIQLTNCI